MAVFLVLAHFLLGLQLSYLAFLGPSSFLFADPILLSHPATNEPPTDAIGFWHIGPGNKNRTRDNTWQILRQWNELRLRDMFKDENVAWKLNAVQEGAQPSDDIWATLANESDGRVRFLRPDHISPNAARPYYEFSTLDMLYKYCSGEEQHSKTVFYIHSKSDTDWRQKMQHVLFDKCYRCLLNDPSKQICGSNYMRDGGVRWCHFSGNFWLARCEHVRKLRPPFDEEILQEAWDAGLVYGGWPHDVRPYGRFFAEYWVMNDWANLPRPDHDAGLLKGVSTKVVPCRIPDHKVCAERKYFG